MKTEDFENFTTLLNMDLHETVELNEISTIMRVPGGWIYIVETSNKGILPHAITSTFVPVPYAEEDMNYTVGKGYHG